MLVNMVSQSATGNQTDEDDVLNFLYTDTTQDDQTLCTLVIFS